MMLSGAAICVRSAWDDCGLAEPLPCVICSEPAVRRCGWPVARRSFILAPEVQVGDIFLTLENKVRCEVMSIQRIERPLATLYMFRVRDMRPQKRGGELYLYERWGTQKVEVQQAGICNAACCYRHCREVGPELGICSMHWAAQLALCELPR